MRLDVAVIGGGLAGISAAIRLADLGYAVALYERSRGLGGRAGSHPDGSGRLLDIGQHVHLGCCTEYLQLLEELGAASLAPTSRRLALTILDAERPGKRREARLAAAPLPSPLSLAAAVLRYRHLRPRERLRALRVVRQARAERKKDDRQAGEALTFGEWLSRRGVGPREMRALWEPLTLAALNSLPHEVDAASGVMLLDEALAGGAGAAAVGIARAPLSRLLEGAAARLSPSGRMHLGKAVSSIRFEGGRAAGIVVGGRFIPARAVLLATGHREALRLLTASDAADHPCFRGLAALKTRPIVNVHLWYDRPVLPEAMVGVIGSPLQWLFDLSTLHGEGGARHLVVSLSGADRAMATPADFLIEEIAEAIDHLFGVGREALVEGAVRKVRHATFVPSPGARALRPPQETPIPGLFLAGDYTATGWPATMEGAVRSGRLAAERAAAYLTAKG